MHTPTGCEDCGLRRDGVTRRDFLSMTALSAIALTLTGCGGGGDDGPTSVGTGTVSVTLADFPGLATVGRTVRVRTTPPIALHRASAGAGGLVAFSLICPHQGSIVGINGDSSMTCPNHGARFTANGTWTGGQSTTGLVRLPVTVDAAQTTATVTLG